MSERWLPVVGYEGLYEVSDEGRVRSLDRYITNPLPGGIIRRQFIKGRIHKGGIAKAGGYPYVNLTRDASRQTSLHVHRLVMEAFVGQLPDGYQTRHLNGDPTDNTLENLAYGTPLENAEDKIRHGRSGVKTHCKRGHDLNGAYITKDGRRDCKACALVRYHEKRARLAA